MYNNVGLRSVRGSGTSGFVERSRAHERPAAYTSASRAPYAQREDGAGAAPRPPALHAGPPGPSVRAHLARRAVEAQCFAHALALQAQGGSAPEIEERTCQLRARLLAEHGKSDAQRAVEARAAKERELERMRRALGIPADAVEGRAFAAFDEGRDYVNAAGMIVPGDALSASRYLPGGDSIADSAIAEPEEEGALPEQAIAGQVVMERDDIPGEGGHANRPPTSSHAAQTDARRADRPPPMPAAPEDRADARHSRRHERREGEARRRSPRRSHY